MLIQEGRHFPAKPIFRYEFNISDQEKTHTLTDACVTLMLNSGMMIDAVNEMCTKIMCLLMTASNHWLSVIYVDIFINKSVA